MLNIVGRNLFKTTFLHRLFTRSSCSSTASDNSFVVSYLINSCGFPRDKANSASKYLKFKTPDRADSVIAFLKNLGFTEPQISDVVLKIPIALKCNPQINFLPKIEFLRSKGLTDSDIVNLLTAIPWILGRSLKNHIEPTFNLLRDLLQSDDRLLLAIRRCPYIWHSSFQADVIPNMQILRNVGVPGSKMLRQLGNQPRDFLHPTQLYKKAVEEVVEMGFDPLKSSFMLALHAVRSMSKSTWEKKLETYKKWGWSEAQILQAFKTHPWCMVKSEEKIDKVMDYLVNKMGFETSLIAKNSSLISYSMEKRIIPRSLLYHYCLDNGLMNDKNYCSFGGWLQCSENRFIKRLERYEKEAPGVLKFYQEKLDHANEDDRIWRTEERKLKGSQGQTVVTLKPKIIEKRIERNIN